MSDHTLVLEQLALHFGDDWDEYYKRTTNFIAALKRKPWWGNNYHAMFSTEGGTTGMIVNALVEVIVKGDFDEGLVSYSQMLAKEYSPAKHGGHHHTLWLGLDVLAGREDITLPQPASEEPLLVPSEAIQWQDSSVDLEEQEQLLFTTIADVGGVKEAIDVLGWPYKEGMNTYWRVKQRMYRAADRAERDVKKLSPSEVTSHMNHVRWHVNRGIISDPCEWCPT